MARFPWVYRTATWQRVREAVIARAHGLCEECQRRGLVEPGAEVDHVIELTDANVHDLSIVYGLDNLQLLCRECHDRKHGRRQGSGLSEFVMPVPAGET